MYVALGVPELCFYRLPAHFHCEFRTIEAELERWLDPGKLLPLHHRSEKRHEAPDHPLFVPQGVVSVENVKHMLGEGRPSQ